MRTNRTNIAITPAEAAELSSALFSSGSAAALELAPVFADIASGKLTAIELAVAGSQASAATGPIVIGELSIDLASRTVKVSDAPVSLTPKEFDILAFLASNRGTVFSKEEIYRAVWQNEYLLDDSNIMAFVRKIRKKIEPEPDNPPLPADCMGRGLQNGRVTLRVFAPIDPNSHFDNPCQIARKPQETSHVLGLAAFLFCRQSRTRKRGEDRERQ